MSCIVFSGPSLAPAEVRRLAPGVVAAPPVKCGDVLRACRTGQRRIAIIDGYFDQALPVWHKEILFALESGCEVWGASSLGALRAVELEAFGMRGVGSVFAWYRDGQIEDDDEVALLHASAEHDYRTASEALVNIRATFAALVDADVLDAAAARDFVSLAKAMHYGARNYPALWRAAEAVPELCQQLPRVVEWLGAQCERRVDIKRADALQLLAAFTRPAEPPVNTPVRVARTEAFCEFLRRTR